MKQVFIDLGCYTGDSIKEFYNWAKVANYDPETFEIYGFDASPNYKKEWETLEKRWPNVTFKQAAAWIKDGEQTFYIGHSAHGSSLMAEKLRSPFARRKITAPTFDFATFLSQFKGADTCILKIDIEGAEFDLLEHLIDTKTVIIPTHILIEWHDHKMKGDFASRREVIERILHNLKVHWSIWG